MNNLKFVSNVFVLGLCVFSLNSCEKISSLFSNTEKEDAKIQTEEEKLSYLLGYILTENTKKTEAHLQAAAFLQGVKDSIQDKQPVLDKAEMKAIGIRIQEKALSETRKRVGEKNKEEGERFLEDNKKTKGVVVTATGLQYEVLKKGQGATPTENDTVEVHYRGTLIDGTEFDSSYKRNKSAPPFPVNAVIKGWTEGLQLMKEGAKYKFYIPSELAYGEPGNGESIPPNSTLIFEVELLKVIKN